MVWTQVPAIFIDCEGLREMGRCWMFGKTPPDTVMRPLCTVDEALRPVISSELPPPSRVVVYRFARTFCLAGRIEMLEFEETYRGPI